MIRYIIRRIAFMGPVVIGVIMITFALFNVAGGSPAAMALGKNASPQSLEEFDEQRGMNKPVLLGWWTATRAHADDVSLEGRPLAAGAGHEVVLAFPLRTQTVYRARAVVASAGGVARLRWESGRPECAGSAGVVLAPGGSREVVDCSFRTGESPSREPLRLRVEEGTCRLYSVSLQRRMTHWYDSQLLYYLGRLAHGDLGVSLATNERVSVMLRRGIGPSLALTVPILAGGVAVSLALALVCAYWRNRWIDRSLVFLGVLLMSVNYIVWIVLGQFLLAFRWHWFPIWGFESWCYVVLPVLIGVLSGLGSNLRFYRTVLLDELYKDYVRTAYAKGLGPVRVLVSHVLPNALIPVVTHVALALPFLYTGSLLLESFFGIPGLGGLSINAINSSDVDVVRGVVLVGSLLYVVASLLVDLCYAWVDPRITLR